MGILVQQSQQSIKNDMKFDNTQAFKEGWSLFNDGEIQRLDYGPIDENSDQTGEPVFDSDEEALDFVKSKYLEGSEYHKQALDTAIKILHNHEKN